MATSKKKAAVRKKALVRKKAGVSKKAGASKKAGGSKKAGASKKTRVSKSATVKSSTGKAGKNSSSNKTIPTKLLPRDYVKSLEHPTRKADAEFLLNWFTMVTGMKPVMWGTSIVGYGRYHYKYDSGRSGDCHITGFSARKSALSVYIMPGYRDMSEYLSRLGKHKTGKCCLYINKLSDIDLDVLAEIVLEGVSYMRKNYPTWDR